MSEGRQVNRLRKSQATTEYLLVYIWAIVIIAIILALLIYFIIAPTYLPPNLCNFVSGAYCKGIIFASNDIGTKIGLFLTNSQSFPILKPFVFVNFSGVSYLGNCLPNFVLPGGAIICNVTLPLKALSLGSLQSGKLYLSAIPCPSGNVTACSATPPQTYAGGFTAHVNPLLSASTVSITLVAANYTQAANGAKDPLTATVKLFGYPLTGATVNFTANVSTATIFPSITTTDTSGKAYSSVSSFTAGKVNVTASFANFNSSVVINFTPPVYVSFEINPNKFHAICGSLNPTQVVVTINNVQYTCSQLPLTLSFTSGATITYAFAKVIQSPRICARYLWNSTTGLGATGINGTIIASSNGTVMADYSEEYCLVLGIVPPNSGSVSASPSTEGNWYAVGTKVTISAVPYSGYFFEKWVGSGKISYTGISSTSSITMDSPITEEAYLYSTTTTTSTSTTTSSTSTSTSTTTSSTTTSTSTTTLTSSTTTSSTTTSTTTRTTTTTSTTTTRTTTTTSTTTTRTTTTTSTSTTTTALPACTCPGTVAACGQPASCSGGCPAPCVEETLTCGGYKYETVCETTTTTVTTTTTSSTTVTTTTTSSTTSTSTTTIYSCSACQGVRQVHWTWECTSGGCGVQTCTCSSGGTVENCAEDGGAYCV